MYSLTLEYPPSLNHYLRRTRNGVYQTAEAAAYKERAALAARLAGIRPLEGEVIVVLDVYRPAKRGDLDNSLKVLLDSMNGLLWHDDAQIVEIHARRLEGGKKNARVEITAWSKHEKDDVE